jgi:hypothetical protein
MPAKDDAAQAARAKRLRKEIEKIKAPPSQAEATQPKTAATPKESPRDFIQRRMRELDQEKRSGK